MVLLSPLGWPGSHDERIKKSWFATQETVDVQLVLAVGCHVTPSYLVMNNHDFPYANLFPPSLNENGLLNIFVLLTCYLLQCQIFRVESF